MSGGWKATASSVACLRSTLENEAERADTIISTFDENYRKCADTAAKILSDDPRQIDPDALHDLDAATDGTGLQVSDTDGRLIASDDLYHHTD